MRCSRQMDLGGYKGERSFSCSKTDGYRRERERTHVILNVTICNRVLGIETDRSRARGEKRGRERLQLCVWEREFD